MATPSSILAWRIPGMGEPGGLPSMGFHRVGHDWRDLAAAAAALDYDTPEIKLKNEKIFFFLFIGKYQDSLTSWLDYILDMHSYYYQTLFSAWLWTFHPPEGAGDAESFQTRAASPVGASPGVLAPVAGPLRELLSLQGTGRSRGRSAFTWGHFSSSLCIPGGAVRKNLLQETQAQSLSRKDPLEEEMATPSSILVWEIPPTEEPGGLQSMGSQRCQAQLSDWTTVTTTSAFIRNNKNTFLSVYVMFFLLTSVLEYVNYMLFSLRVTHFQFINTAWKGRCSVGCLAEPQPCTNSWPNVAFVLTSSWNGVTSGTF